MKNIIIFGPPGTGKGTLSKRLAIELDLKHISTGDIIRKNQENNTKIGNITERMTSSGNLIPDNIINEMIKQEIIEGGECHGFIFDGFPRTAGQAKMIDQLLNKRGNPISEIIYLDTPKWIAKNRVIERGKYSERKDDTPEVFENRWSVYSNDTIPAINYFKSRGLFHTIDGCKDIDDVYRDVISIIKKTSQHHY